jgi:hypothetical protein
VPSLSTEQFQAWGVLVATGIFSATIYLTRARYRRSMGALLAALVMSVLNVFWDIAAHQFGWWTYPSQDRAFAPVAVYLAQNLVWGGAFGLVGWRIHRRFGAGALFAFVALLSGIGAVRDWLVSWRTHVILFGPGSVPVLADFACWATLLTTTQITIRVVSGPPARDFGSTRQGSR